MTLLNGIELFFVVVYAVVSCGLIGLSLFNMRYKQIVNWTMMQGIVSVVLLYVFVGSQYENVYRYIALLSCFTSVLVTLFGGNE